MLHRAAEPTVEVFGVIRGTGATGARAVVSHVLGRALDAALVFWLFVTNGAVFPLLASDPSGEISGQDRFYLRVFIVMAFGLMLILAAIYPRRLINGALAWPLLLLILGWVLASISWSVDPQVSTQRAFAFVVYSLLPILISLRFGPERFIRIVATVFALQLFMSLVFIVALPRLGWMPLGDAARGIFLHKNVLGELLVMATVALVCAWTGRLLPRWFMAGAFAAILILLVLTKSATAIMLIGALAVVVTLDRLGRIGRPAPAAIALAVAVGCFFAIVLTVSPDLLFQILGRDPTLTGRVDLWRFVLSLIAERPFLGYGFRAAFEQPWVAGYVGDAFGWAAPNAHNGYIECLLDVGVVGLVLAVAFLLTQLVAATRLLREIDHPSARFALLMVIVFFLRNVVESDLLLQTNMSWVLLIVVGQHVMRIRADRLRG